MPTKKDILHAESALLNEISALIEQGQAQVVSQVNSALTMLFWQVGRRINEFVLEHKRAECGKQIVVTLSRHLSWSHFLALLPLAATKKQQSIKNIEQKKGLM